MHTAAFRDAKCGHRSIITSPIDLQPWLTGFTDCKSQNSGSPKAIRKIPCISKSLVCLRDALDNSNAVKKYEWMDPARYLRYSIPFQRVLPAIRITWQDGWYWITWIQLDLVLPPLPADIQSVRASLARRNVPFINIDRHHINQFALAFSERQLRQEEFGQCSQGPLAAAFDHDYQSRLDSVFESILRGAESSLPKRVERQHGPHNLHELRLSRTPALSERARIRQRNGQMARHQHASGPVRQVSLL